jgi:HlyD family secretion protein
MKIRPGKLLMWGSALLVTGVFAWSSRPQPVRVDTAVLQMGPLCVTIDEEGMTRVRERYVAAAPVAGRMQRVELKPGDAVAAGTVLATFLPSVPPLLDTRTRAETEAKVKAAQATRDHARVAVHRASDDAAFSRSELDRQRQIAEFGGVTEERLAAAELDARTKDTLVDAAQLMLQKAEHELDASRAVLRQVVIPPAAASSSSFALRSPESGIVLRVLQESEAPVPAGAPLIEIGNPRRLEIVADLLSTDAVKVQPGFRVQINGWGGSAPLAGRVRLVEPAGFTRLSTLGVEEQRVNVLIDFDAPHGEARKLGDGYRVETSIVASERRNVLKVPTSALFRVGETWAVFAIRDGQAAQTAVQVGLRNAIEAEVLSGLDEGDQVIVHPGDTIASGVRVTPR